MPYHKSGSHSPDYCFLVTGSNTQDHDYDHWCGTIRHPPFRNTVLITYGQEGKHRRDAMMFVSMSVSFMLHGRDTRVHLCNVLICTLAVLRDIIYTNQPCCRVTMLSWRFDESPMDQAFRDNDDYLLLQSLILTARYYDTIVQNVKSLTKILLLNFRNFCKVSIYSHKA